MEVSYAELDLVHQALAALIDNGHYTNCINFGYMTTPARARWWHRAQHQADQGIETMLLLKHKVIELRLKQ